VPLHELLLPSEGMKHLIQTRSQTTQMLTLAMKEGLVTLVQDGIRKALQGVTTYRQVRAVAMK
jgi:type II secretory ATPase GspE/PulE/Tfp pilus assembly ATPase PilB-like protein